MIHYLENKVVGVVDFTKGHGLAFEILPISGFLLNLLLPLYFRGNVSLPSKKIWGVVDITIQEFSLPSKTIF